MSKELQEKLNHAAEAAQVLLDELLNEIEKDK
jgi:hypothetical protein